MRGKNKQHCAVCYAPFDIDGEDTIGDVLTHLVASHPDNDDLDALLSETPVPVTCEDCRESFGSSLQTMSGSLWVRRFCDDCAGDTILAGLVRRIPADEAIAGTAEKEEP